MSIASPPSILTGSCELLVREAARCGAGNLVLPVVATTVLSAWSVLMSHGAADQAAVGQGLVRLGVFLLPPIIGLASASALARESMVELQLMMPMPYSHTVARRAVVMVLVAVVCASAFTAALAVQGLWSAPAAWLAPIIIAAPAVAMTGAAVWCNQHVCSAAVASSAVLTLWLFQLAFWDVYVREWTVNKLVLLLGGLLLVMLGVGRAGDEAAILRSVR